MIPFPSEEVTPPVTKTYLVLLMFFLGLSKSTNSCFSHKQKHQKTFKNKQENRIISKIENIFNFFRHSICQK